MNRMTATALAWWDGRTTREQRMLMVMGLAVAAVLAWLLAVRPAWTWRADARDARARAEADLATVQGAVARLGGETPTSNGTVDLQAMVAEANGVTGLTPVMGMSPDGGLGFSLANVSTAAAFGWLAALHDRNVEAAALSVVENTDATISVEGALVSRH